MTPTTFPCGFEWFRASQQYDGLHGDSPSAEYPGFCDASAIHRTVFSLRTLRFQSEFQLVESLRNADRRQYVSQSERGNNVDGIAGSAVSLTSPGQ
jgi:hypothetical protein